MAIPLMERPTLRPPKLEPAPEPGRWLMAMGAATLILGVVALAAASLTTVMSVVVLGCFAILGAIFQSVFAFTSGRWQGFGLHALLAVLYGIVGVYLVANPLAGAVALTVALGFLFAVSGIFRIAASWQARYPAWGWSFFSGAVTAALGVYVLKNVAGASMLLLGTLFGVDMIFFGGGLMGLGSALRRRTVVR